MFKFSLVSKRFYAVARENKKIRSVMKFSKYILNFDEDYFDFLKKELRYLSKNIRGTFGEKKFSQFLCLFTG